MPIVQEPAKQIPIVGEFDIVVIGGSCTGVFAAVRAARLGAKVAIIEKQNCFGGMATGGFVHIWHSLHDTTGSRRIIGGLTWEMLDRLKMRNAVSDSPDPVSAFKLNTEELKIELDEIVIGEGITPYLHTFYAAPVLDEGRLTGVIVENKSGRQAVRGQCFIDATGDGDLARDLGVPQFERGPLQPPTTCAKILGLSTLGEFNWSDAVREHGHEFGLEDDWGWGAPIPGVPGLEMRADTHVFDTDAADAAQLTAAEITGRRKIRAILDVIRKYGPGGHAVGLAGLAASLGIRETHRFKCAYQLTGDDVLHGKRFDDAIANGSYRVDIHHDDGPGTTFRYLDGTEETIPGRGLPVKRGRWRDPLPEDPTLYQIPLRSLLSPFIPNLVLAGRMLDADKVAFSAVRVMVNLNQTGEAAGVACALACKKGKPVPELNTEEVRQMLADGGSVVI